MGRFKICSFLRAIGRIFFFISAGFLFLLVSSVLQIAFEIAFESWDSFLVESLPKEEIKNGRAVEVINGIKAKAKVNSEVKLFMTFLGLPLNRITEMAKNDDENYYFIVTSKFILQKWPDNALLGLMAHEVCHIVVRHQDERRKIVTGGLREAEADACALTLVGENPVRLALSKFLSDADVENRLARADSIRVAVKTKFLSHMTIEAWPR